MTMRAHLVGLALALASLAPCSARAEPHPVPWRAGEPVPSGYHVETPVAAPLIVAGGLGFAIPYGFSVALVGAVSNTETLPLLVPGVGPFLQIAVSHSAHGSQELSGLVDGLLVMDGVLQSLGIALIVWGASLPSAKLVSDSPQARLVPVAPGGAPGLSLFGTF